MPQISSFEWEKREKMLSKGILLQDQIRSSSTKKQESLTQKH